jgi:hypothetical protein
MNEKATQLFLCPTIELAAETKPTLMKREQKTDRRQHGAKQQFYAGLLQLCEQSPSFLL